MLCWLASGEYEALRRDMKRAEILIPAQGIQTSTFESYPQRTVQTPSTTPPKEAQMLCWPASGEHEAIQRDMLRVGFLILTDGKTNKPCSNLLHGQPGNNPTPPFYGRLKYFAG